MFSALELPIVHTKSTMVPCVFMANGALEAAEITNRKKAIVLNSTMGSSHFSPPQLPPPPLPHTPALATPIAEGTQPARARGSPRARRTNAASPPRRVDVDLPEPHLVARGNAPCPSIPALPCAGIVDYIVDLGASPLERVETDAERPQALYPAADRFPPPSRRYAPNSIKLNKITLF